eukprot:TRINITY_DN22799_c0_g1_i1.p1 TRINITY_DN22799_c0_g1~~TRINITY_DN22799_c0_g1_i1.p1  ORF type:complete len:544 (+),score=82.64 TRINITY_DN22799_c0_g1_i1:90-1721(+)
MDVSELLNQGKQLLDEFRIAFADLPQDALLKQPVQWPLDVEGAFVPNWLEFLNHILEHGSPYDPTGHRFSLEVYGVPSSIPISNIHIHSVASGPTFFGNYPPPDDLHGQMIDLVATQHPEASKLSLSIAASTLRLKDELGTIAEIQEMQNMKQDRTTLGSLGLIPLEVASVASSIGTALHLGQIPGIKLQSDKAALDILEKKFDQKVVISDHVPISFDIHVNVAEEANEKRRCLHRFSAMSMNMLAHEYLPLSFWNAEPSSCSDQVLRELWFLASRFRSAADRKTKWLPRQYSDMCRTGISDEELSIAEDSAMVRWERLNRKFWNWIVKVQKDVFHEQVQCNPFAHDDVRLGVLSQLLMKEEESSLPDFLILQEVGLSEFVAADFLDEGDNGPGCKSFPSAAFSQKLEDVYPALEPMLQSYQVINASPKLNVRRGGKVQCTDTGILLAKKSLMTAYVFEPITQAAQEPCPMLQGLYNTNAGKPIVGVHVRQKTGIALMNLFGAHFEKGKTQQLLQELFRILEETQQDPVPTLVAGDFNAVLKR